MSAGPYADRYGYAIQPKTRKGPRTAYRDTVLEWAAAQEELATAKRTNAPTDQIDTIAAKVAALAKLVQMAEQALTGGNVSKLDAAKAALNNDMATHIKELRQLDADKKKYPLDYYAEERARLLALVKATDAQARNLFEEYQAETALNARRLRAAAEDAIDPMVRVGDELERARLASSNVDPKTLLQRAQDALDLGQAHRASVLLAAAKDKGVTRYGDLERKLEDALDAEVPQRTQARQIEDELVARTIEFREARLVSLTTSSIGIDDQDGVGTGSASDVAAASVRAKGLALNKMVNEGTPYVEPFAPVGATQE